MRFLAFAALVACEQKAAEVVAQADIIPASAAVKLDACPAWSDLRACKADGFVYATAKGAGIANSRLAETTAKNRARFALSGEKSGDVVIEQSEIPAVASCADGVHALARAPVGKLSGQTLAACDASLASPPPPDGCPDWTTKRTWREGANVYAVSVIDPKLPLPLAQTEAENAARADAQQYFHFAAKAVGGTTSTTTAGMLPSSTGHERVECGGKTYVRLAFASGH